MRLVRPSPILAALLVLAASASPAAGARSAPSGGLHFVECLTGKYPYGLPKTPRAGGCNLTRTVAGDGERTAVNHLSGLAVSPDGSSLYAASSRDDSVAAFSPRPLQMTQCFTTQADLRTRAKQPCVLLPNAGTEDVSSGFNGVREAIVSPDGRDVYTVSPGDDSIATFARAPSGEISFVGCITGELGKFASAANGSCEAIPGATAENVAGLSGVRSLVISPDGRFAYVSLNTEAGIATLARDSDGSLHFLGCLRGNEHYAESPNSIHSPCTTVAPGTDNPNASGLSSPAGMAISPDGRSLYAVSAEGAAIAEFRRDPISGSLTFSGCLAAANRGTGPADPCRYVPQANEVGVVTAMFGMREIAMTPDGTGLYGVSTYDSAVAAFARDRATGRLTFRSCVDAESRLAHEFGVRDPCTKLRSNDPDGRGSGLGRPRGLTISGDGRSLLVGSREDSAISRFRLTRGGGLHFAGCISADPETRCARARTPAGKPQLLGFDGFDSLVTTGHTLYAAAGDGSSIARFTFP